MARILRTASAKRDIRSIVEYIAAYNPSAAERWIERLDETFTRIAQFPLIGEQVDHLSAGARRHCFGNYLLFYTPIEGGIRVLRVLHGARRIEDLL